MSTKEPRDGHDGQTFCSPRWRKKVSISNSWAIKISTTYHPQDNVFRLKNNLCTCYHRLVACQHRTTPMRLQPGTNHVNTLASHLESNIYRIQNHLQDILSHQMISLTLLSPRIINEGFFLKISMPLTRLIQKMSSLIGLTYVKSISSYLRIC